MIIAKVQRTFIAVSHDWSKGQGHFKGKNTINAIAIEFRTK